MDKIIQSLFTTLSANYGLVGTVFIIGSILIIGYCIYLFLNSLPSAIQKGFKDRKKINIQKHDTFKELKFLLQHKLKDVNTTCIIRKQLYIDILSEKISCLKKHLQNFVKQDLQVFSKRELYIRVQSTLDDAAMQAQKNNLMNGVPKFILDSMDKRVFSIDEFYKNQIKSCCYNSYLYHNNKARMCAILDMLSVSTEYYMNLLEEDLATFNGNVKGLVYKGIGCANCTNCVHEQYLKELQKQIKEETALIKLNELSRNGDKNGKKQ